jgi:hypothetical protein
VKGLPEGAKDMLRIRTYIIALCSLTIENISDLIQLLLHRDEHLSPIW